MKLGLRKLVLPTAITFLLALTVMAQPAVTSNALQRTFCIKFGGQTGTCFTLDVDNRQYLITARHVVAGIQSEGLVEVLRDGKWWQIPVKALFPSPESVDIAVLALPTQLSPSLPLPAGGDTTYYLSQEVYFLGYPFGLAMDSRNLNAGFPLPFVKRGILSAFVDAEGGAPILVIDGINNPGFSGGPVVVADMKTGQLAVIGVISGYRFQEDMVLDGGKPTQLSVRNNSGLILAYGIVKALEAIKANPVGALLPNH